MQPESVAQHAVRKSVLRFGTDAFPPMGTQSAWDAELAKLGACSGSAHTSQKLDHLILAKPVRPAS